jgi:YesN/AraC family two-component response regulator
MTYYVDNVKYEMSSGDIIYVPAGSIRQREVGKVLNDYFSINFHSSEPLPLENLSKNCINNEVKMLLGYIEAIYSSRMPETSRKKISYILEAIVMQISDNLAESITSSLSNTIVEYLYSHYQERITLKDISQMTYFSAAYCESEFKRQMGTSIIQYLLDIRIEEAKRLLSESSMSCSRIANAVGFEDANYFSRIFKKKTGYSPIGYRRFSSI